MILFRINQENEDQENEDREINLLELKELDEDFRSNPNKILLS